MNNNFTFDMQGIHEYHTNYGSRHWHKYVTNARGTALYVGDKLIIPTELKTYTLDQVYNSKKAIPAVKPFYDYVKNKYIGIS